jgi:hypothetical protein
MMRKATIKGRFAKMLKNAGMRQLFCVLLFGFFLVNICFISHIYEKEIYRTPV